MKIQNLLNSFLIMMTLTQSASALEFLPLRQGNGDPEHFSNRPDLAYVEAAKPLSRADRQAITVDQLKQMSQEQLDQIYARIGSGPIPSGDYSGSIIIRNEMLLQNETKLVESLGKQGFLGFVSKIGLTVLCRGKSKAECIGEMLWSGKRFYAPDSLGQVQLRNGISKELQQPLILKQAGLDALIKPLAQARVENFNGTQKMMLFPANVYCGLSLFDVRRESVLIDYAYGDDFQPFIPEIDAFATRKGVWVRDEIRMIRPGLYLGRAYMDRVFALNFVLENNEVARRAQGESAWKNQCWSGASWQ